MKGKQLGVSVLVALIMIVYVLYHYDFFDRFKKSSTSTNGEGITRNIIKNSIKTNLKQPEKDKLLLKMLDSVDYFNQLEGEYEQYFRFTNEVDTVKYAVDTDKQWGMRIVLTNHRLDKTILYSGNENKKIDFDERAHTYRVWNWKPDPKNEEIEKLSASERIYQANDRQDDDYARGTACDVVHSELTNYLLDFDKWDYKEVTFLGLPSYKITGVIDDGGNMDGKFEMIVEKSAGLVLDFHVYDEKGKVKYYLETKYIKIDKGLDDKVFEKDLSKYKKVK